MKKNGKSTASHPKKPEFVLLAERGFRLAAQDVKKRNKAFALPLLVWRKKMRKKLSK